MSERGYIQQFGRALRKPPVVMVGEYSGETYCGLPIIISPMCRVPMPARKHIDRGEMRRNRFFARPFLHKPSAYHKRIQKKWVKRFGMSEGDVLHITSTAAFMSRQGFDRFMAMRASTPRVIAVDDLT